MSRVGFDFRELTRREDGLGGLRLRSCPRCRGDVVLERDRWGSYEQCIQCGYLRDLEDIVEGTAQRA